MCIVRYLFGFRDDLFCVGGVRVPLHGVLRLWRC